MGPLAPLRRIAQPFGLVTPWIRIRPYTVRVKADDGSRDPPRTKAKPQHRILSTLNSALIRPSDHVDLSDRTSISVGFDTESREGESASFEYIRRGLNPHPFPPGAAGFLYYHKHPHAAPLEGSIRLRVTDDSSPSSFSHGQDLCLPSGFPWQLIMPQIACRVRYQKLGAQLVRENLATSAQLLQCIALYRNARLIHPTATLFRLDQEFPVDFSGTVHLTAVGKVRHMIRLSMIFKAHAVKGTRSVFFAPWTGSAIVRFEASTNPAHAGRRVVHLRIVKILTPVTRVQKGHSGRVLQPQEGELLTVTYYSDPPAPWGYDIDHMKTFTAVALRDLWDHSPHSTPTSPT
ncbi:hypothetical protein C8R47DRAFT_709162 [Mycena vitilis]|nr:hypothetical protein C8R47DRAFT_709162 [Mycena vitilis]